MARHQDPVAAGQERVGEPELDHRGGDLRHLGLGVGAGVVGVGDDPLDGPLLDALGQPGGAHAAASREPRRSSATASKRLAVSTRVTGTAGIVLAEALDGHVHIRGGDLQRKPAPPGLLGGQERGPRSTERLEHRLPRVGVGIHDERRQPQREHRRVVDALSDGAALPGHRDHRVGNAVVLSHPAHVVPGGALALAGAQPAAARPIGAQMHVLARELAGDDLVGLARLAVEVEDELVARRQTPSPVPGHGHRLIPHVPPEEAPALLGHPRQPVVPVADDRALAMDQAEVDQHLAVGVRGRWANTPRIRASQSSMPPVV